MIDTDKYAMKLAMSIANSPGLACDSTASPRTLGDGHPVCIEADECIFEPKLPGGRRRRLLGCVVYEITVTAKYVDIESE
jgi:hypothetical protein